MFTETLNIDQSYLFQIDFYTLDDSIPKGWTCKIKTYTKSEIDGKLIPQQTFKLMKNDLNSFSFNINKVVDQYIHIETKTFNDFGIGYVNDDMQNISTSKKYILINNNFTVPGTNNHLTITDDEITSYYWFDDNGYIWLDD
jgi:hypothetical protein